MKLPLADHAQLPEKVKNMLMLSSFHMRKNEEYVFDTTPGPRPDRKEKAIAKTSINKLPKYRRGPGEIKILN